MEEIQGLRAGKGKHLVQAPARVMVDDEQDANARVVAKGYRDPDLRDGFVETSGRVSIRPLTFSSFLWVLLKNGLF